MYRCTNYMVRLKHVMDLGVFLDLYFYFLAEYIYNNIIRR